MIIMVWTSLGFNMVIYLAGLQNISRDLYEAADVDGASPLRQFFQNYITFTISNLILPVNHGDCRILQGV